jgi:hypothetical protein
MGRPTLMTQECIESIMQYIAAGEKPIMAARANGVRKSTFLSWTARGRAERERLENDPKAKIKASERPFMDFLDRIEEAEAKYITFMSATLTKAAKEPKNWRAALEILERRDPENWSKTSRTEISGPNGGPVRQETTVSLSEAEIIALADKLSGIGPILPMAQPIELTQENENE